jgi:hypothetical protein
MSNAEFIIRKLETTAFDSRVVARQLASGRITPKELTKHLKGLADSADNAEEITVTLADEEEDEAEAEGEATDDDAGDDGEETTDEA